MSPPSHLKFWLVEYAAVNIVKLTEVVSDVRLLEVDHLRLVRVLIRPHPSGLQINFNSTSRSTDIQFFLQGIVKFDFKNLFYYFLCL